MSFDSSYFPIVRAALLLVALACPVARAQAPAPLPEVNVSVHRAGFVNAMARQPDGGIVIGGTFRSINGQPRTNLARLRPDGTLDPDWTPTANNSVSEIAVDASGAVYIGGAFSSVNGQLRQRLARLAGSGSGALDATFAPANDGEIFALAVDASGKVFVGGTFTQIGGAARAGLARLAGSGTADADWNPSPDALVSSIALGAGGDVFVSGSFSTIAGKARAGLAKVLADGSADAAWDPLAAGNVFAVAVGPGGDVYVAGAFSNIGGQARVNLAKLAATGSGAADATWNPNPDNPVGKLAFAVDGALYVAGTFNVIAGQSRPGLARLTASGTAVADAAFNPASLNNQVEAIVGGADGRVLIGGSLRELAGAQPAGVIALGENGVALAPIDAERSGEVRALARQADGAIVFGGEFRRVDAHLRANLARLRADGSLDPDWNPNANATIFTLATQADGSVYAGGIFTRVDGLSRSSLVKLDAAGEVVAAWTAGTNGSVSSIAPDAAGSVFIAGSFTGVGAQVRNGLAKLSSATGAPDVTWNPAANGSVARVVADGAGSVFVGGGFSSVGGASRARLAKLSATGTGTADATWNPGPNGNVTALAMQGAALYVAGAFNSIGGVSIAGLARVATTGTGVVDAAFNPSPLGSLQALAPDIGALHFGGSLFSVRGTTRRGVAKVSAANGALDTAWNPDPFSLIHAVFADGNGAVYVAGTFTAIGGAPRDALAKLRTRYTRSYLAGANGVITGTTPQTVQHGAAATAVTAAPAAGFHFVQWSDGSVANPRTDANVTSDATFTAAFGNNAPQIAAVAANPATLFEAESAVVTATASDRESATLAFRFDCNADGVFELGPQAQASANCAFPAPGTHRVNVRVADGPGAEANAFVDVVVNDSLAQAVFTPPAEVDEDMPIPITATATVPSSAESVVAIDVDCDFDGITFDLELSSSFPNPNLACDGIAVGGPLTLAVRPRDNRGEAGLVASATVMIRPINDAPVFTVGADIAGDEDAAVQIDDWTTNFAAGPGAAVDEATQALTFEVIANSQPGLFASGPAIDAQGRLAFVPAANANGEAALLVRLCDNGASAPPNDNCSDAQTFEITLAPVNDAPSASLAALPREAAGSSGPRAIAGFATFDAGPSDEEATQAVQDYLVDTVLDPDAVLVPASVVLDDDGTLHYTLTGASGSAAVALRVRDTGGTARGGVDVSSTMLFTLSVGAAADLQVALDNGVARLVDGQAVLYALVVANAGPNAVNGATLTDRLPSTLVDVQWTCVQAQSTGTCPPAAAGEGDIELAFDLAADRLLRFDVIARVDVGGGNAAIHIAEVALPDGVSTINASNDRAVDQDPILVRGVFGHGFEASGAPVKVSGGEAAMRVSD